LLVISTDSWFFLFVTNDTYANIFHHLVACWPFSWQYQDCETLPTQFGGVVADNLEKLAYHTAQQHIQEVYHHVTNSMKTL
jgi:hypothetical protein